MRILILGVNGFIGSHLAEKILESTDWDVYGMDIGFDKIKTIKDNRFHFVEGDITINKEWVEYQIKKSAVVLPLVAIATPATYIKEPLRVFELDFEANLEIIRTAVRYDTRVIFPSTSEVYGMCADEVFDEEDSNFVLGPINKQRWIYSCCKQLLDRVIWAYGIKEGFQFTIIRPYNWIGPKLDDVYTMKEGSSRVVAQFISNVLNCEPLKLVNGGLQRRCFLYIDDGIECLMRIIENKDGNCNGQILNIGNPQNDFSIKELAYKLKELFESHPLYTAENIGREIEIQEICDLEYYGEGYQDVSFRVPSIEKAKRLIGWTPKHNFEISLKKTVDFYIKDKMNEDMVYG